MDEKSRVQTTGEQGGGTWWRERWGAVAMERGRQWATGFAGVQRAEGRGQGGGRRGEQRKRGRGARVVVVGVWEFGAGREGEDEGRGADSGLVDSVGSGSADVEQRQGAGSPRCVES